MLRFSATARFLFAGLFILVVLMRMNGAHLHYCFDGKEPAVSLHLDSDGGMHHAGDDRSQAKHSDIDVPLKQDVPIKSDVSSLDLLALFVALPLLAICFLCQRRVLPSLENVLPPVGLCFYGIPPLRGPPL